VFIGTTQGLIVYDGVNPIDDANSYTLFSTSNILPVNNIRGVCFDKETGYLILATDAGIIIFKYK